MPVLIVTLMVIAAGGLGLQVLAWLRVRLDSDADCLLLGWATGLLAMAYTILLAGLLGWLTRPVLAAIWLSALALGALRLRWMLATCYVYGRRILGGFRRWPSGIALAVLLYWLAMTIPVAVMWPTGNDYDGLAEHLPQAAAYLRMHAVQPLWYDHHSQFPSNLQMLYTMALSFGGPSGPKLIHFFFGLLTMAGAYVLTRRHLSAAGAKWAPVIISATPLFCWMTAVSYVDLGVCAYVMLAVHMCLNWRRNLRGSDLALAGLMGGAAMGVKMQGIPYYGVLLLAVAYLAVRYRKPHLWRHVAAFALVGAAIASPWYIKSWVITGNPVYPFAYSVFGGKQWSAPQAEVYDLAQKAFGVGALPGAEQLKRMSRLARMFVGPRRPDRLLLAPFNLTFEPWHFETTMGYKMTALTMQGPGPLYLGLAPLLLLMRRRRREAAILGWLFLPLWAWWLYSMQLARYLLPTILLLAPLAAYGLAHCLRSHRLLALAGVLLMVFGAGARYVVTTIAGVQGASAALGGARDEVLLDQLDVYEPSLYISRNLPQNAKILTYGEPRVFYFFRDAMWGDPGHHRLIPYDRLRTPRQLVDAYRSLGVTHVLINQQFFPDLMTSQDKLKVLVRRAVDEGLLVPVTAFVRHPNFILLEIAPAQPAGGRS